MRQLLLSQSPGELRAALVEDGRIVELRVERAASASLLGAIFLARVVRSLPALPGAFLDIGEAMPGFLPLERRAGAELPHEGAALIVQVAKEAHGDKPPELTASLSIGTPHLVWTPMRPGIAVSRQIEPAERARLSSLLKAIVGQGDGVVVRTHGAGAGREDLQSEIDFARRRHAALTTAAKSVKPPARLDPVQSPCEPILQSLQGVNLDQITVDDPALDAAIRRLQGRSPGKSAAGIDIDRDRQAFAGYGFDDAFEDALQRRVPLQGGGDIVIDAAEACTLIDVNLGASRRKHAGEAVLDTNKRAAAEAARQIRLRGIAGAIVIDFISMKGRQDRQAVEDCFTQAALNDPATIEIHGWTRLGHLEVTRQRQRPSLAETLLEKLSPPQKTAETIGYAVLRSLAQQKLPPGNLELTLHPGIAKLLDGVLQPWFREAARRGGRKIILKPDAARAPESFDIAPAPSSMSHHD